MIWTILFVGVASAQIPTLLLEGLASTPVYLKTGEYCTDYYTGFSSDLSSCYQCDSDFSQGFGNVFVSFATVFVSFAVVFASFANVFVSVATVFVSFAVAFVTFTNVFVSFATVFVSFAALSFLFAISSPAVTLSLVMTNSVLSTSVEVFALSITATFNSGSSCGP